MCVGKKDYWLELDGENLLHLHDNDPVDEYEFTMQVEEVKAAINQLPVKYKTVVNLHVFEKMTFEEIAVLMGLPPPTIRSQYLRARQKIITMVDK